MSTTLLSLALFWIGASADQASQAPTAAAETAQSEEKGPERESPWGEPVEGLQCRLRAEKVIWTLSEMNQQRGGGALLKVDFRNGSRQAWQYSHPPAAFLDIQWDGTWHHLSLPTAATSRLLRPGQVVENVSYTLGGDLMYGGDDASTSLAGSFTVGPHTVRVASQFLSGEMRVKVVSNPLKIEIVAGEPGRPKVGQSPEPRPAVNEPPAPTTIAAEKTAPNPQGLPEVAKTGNRTPEELASTILEYLRKHDLEGLAERALFSDEDAKAMVRRLEEALGPAGGELPPPFQRGIEGWDGEDLREDWARLAKSDLGIDWARAKLERVNCQIATANGIVGASGIDIIFSVGDDRRYGLFVDDCYMTDRGWLAADGPTWKGVVPPDSTTREEVDALLGSLKADDPLERKGAVEKLGNLAVKRAAGPLIELLNEPDGDFRRAVITALGEIGDPAAANSLKPLLEHSERVTRLVTVRALGQLQWQPAPGRDRILYYLAKESWEDALKAAPFVHQTQPNAVQIGMPLSDGLFVLPFDVCVTQMAERDASQLRAVVGYPWIEFKPASRGAEALLHVQFDSWPKTRWTAKLEFLGANGEPLGGYEKAFENSGTIVTYPHREAAVVRFLLPDELERAEPKSVRLSLESTYTEEGNPLRFGEKTALSLSLDYIERSDAIVADWMTLNNPGGGIIATLHLRKAAVQPSEWRLRLRLFDSNGQKVGWAETDLVDDGGQKRRLNPSEATVKLSVGGNSERIQAATRYHLSLERTAVARTNPKAARPTAKTGPPPVRQRPETGPTRGTFLFIRTKPDGAKVLIDGKQVGLSDDLFPVDPGVRRIVVELEGHDPGGREVTIRAGRIERGKLLLTKRPSARAEVPGGQVPPEERPETSHTERAHQPSPNWPLLQGGHVLTPSTILDLANRQLFSYETPGIDLKRVESCLRTGRGDLYYEHDLLGCMRGCTARVWKHTEFVKPRVESVEPKLGLTLYRVAPGARLLISTPEKKHFEVTLLGQIQGQMAVKYEQADPTIVPKSQPPEAAPDDTTPWGKPVEGIRCRLRAERVIWHVAELGRSGRGSEDEQIRMQLEKAIHDHQQQQKKLDEASRLELEELIRELQVLQSSSRPFGLKLDIENNSKRTWYAMPPAGELNVEWDGEWSHTEFLGEIEPWPIRPGDDLFDRPVHLGHVVGPPNGPTQDGAQIKATPGWHTVRLAVSLSSNGRRISVVSNPVKVQIVDGKTRAENPEAEPPSEPPDLSLLLSPPTDQNVEDPPADAEEDGEPNPPKLRSGDRAPSFTGTTLNGSTLKLDDYKGKVVLLDFWATWCPP